MVDAFKLRTYYQALPMARYHVSKVSDEDLKKPAPPSNPRRKKLLEDMMEPFTPQFMREAVAPKAEPIPGLKWRTAEGIMRAIEAQLITHDAWRTQVFPVWQQVLATAEVGELLPLSSW